MSYKLALDDEKTRILLIALITLSFLIYIAGLLTGLMIRPPDDDYQAVAPVVKAPPPVIVEKVPEQSKVEKESEPPAEPEPVKAETKPLFALELNAYLTQAKAEELSKSFKKEFDKAQIRKKTADTGLSWYTVQLGEYTLMADLTSAKSAFTSLTHLPVTVEDLQEMPPVLEEGPIMTEVSAKPTIRGKAVRVFGDWFVVDEILSKEASKWDMQEGIITQTSNIYGGSNSGKLPAKPGTYALLGQKDWGNYEVTLSLRSGDDDAIGVIFRYQNEDNYYRFSMDSSRKYRRLIKKSAGEYHILAEELKGYDQNRWYLLRIHLSGNQIQVYLDEHQLFTVEDDTFKTGRVGLYCWGNQDAAFKNILVSFLPEPASPMMEDLQVSPQESSVEIAPPTKAPEEVQATAPIEVTPSRIQSIPPPTPDSKFTYAVLTNAFSNEKDARKFSMALKKKGYDPMIYQGPDDNNKEHFTVLIGTYQNQEKAIEAAEAFKRKEKLSAIITYIDPRFKLTSKKTQTVSAPPQTKNTDTIKTPPKPTSPSAISKNEDGGAYPYSIRLASFRTIERVKKAIEDYHTLGLEPYVIKVYLGDLGTWWRVYLGYYETKAEARAIQKQYHLNAALVRKTPYAIRVGKFDPKTEKASKQTLLSQLHSLNYFPYAISDRDGLETIYVGVFITRSGAKQVQAELLQQGVDCQIVHR